MTISYHSFFEGNISANDKTIVTDLHEILIHIWQTHSSYEYKYLTVKHNEKSMAFNKIEEEEMTTMLKMI